MKFHVFLCCGLIICGCSSVAERKLKKLEAQWKRQHIEATDKETLQKRYQAALSYLQKHRVYTWDSTVFDCSVGQDTLLLTPKTFRISQHPVRIKNLDENVYKSLIANWACESYKKPLSSLYTKQTESIRTPSNRSNLVYDHVSSATDKVFAWREKHRPKTEQVFYEIVQQLPSDDTSDLVVLFEIPTGKTIRAHIVNITHYKDLVNLVNQPDQLLFSALAADEVVITFNEQNKIVDVFWGGWIR